MPLPLHRPGRAVVLAVGVLAGAVITSCGGADFEDRTARVTIEGETTVFELDTCGLDGSTVFLVGRSTSGSVLQAVVGLEVDGTSGSTSSTGLTVDQDGTEFDAFGAEAWERRSGQGPSPGKITRAELKGSRIQVGGRAAATSDGGPTTPAVSAAFSLDARCDDRTG